ncbi:MAG: 30S ribosomal protein S24e [Candidatus Methanomethylicota archaeon]|jgi:ribosomal protein S24E|uniref:Small ribosomal subunit protein eS24 n=1 Tax=Thermoproteota archaeon TaxID=2056631 RepID=A0A520KEI9_9CREN|nr:30S ribosomal protein S24e [Candidatus Methanomethylicia archaeon]NHV45646.1 30S ribosomal protein S24e [Candidatus Verstraetearchaeota archaeon]RZN55546.1 MAG: 30S ribosomal protein S24e [Candidatus Verstraetearchaeota archaeon]TDA39384.1 MAG: 30S ribosomal protein S24e [Candidatus Verstraetearchaeota archaeon]
MSSEGVQISIIDDKYNSVIKRRELKLEIVSKSTPSRDSLRKILADFFKVPIECLFVISCITSFGTNTSICRVHIYNDAEYGKKIEPKHIQLRNLPREERKKLMSK